jgi:hypothetical protein
LLILEPLLVNTNFSLNKRALSYTYNLRQSEAASSDEI